MKSVKTIIVALGVGLCANAQAVSDLSQNNVEGLTVDSCVALALQNNRALKNKTLEIASGKEQEKEMKAKYLPEISANVMAFHTFDKIIKGDGTYPEEIAALEPLMPGISQMVGQSFTVSELNRGYSATITAMLPLYAGGQITTANKLARVGSEVAVLQRQLTEMDVVEKVTENYWQIAQLRYNLRTVAAAEKQMDAVMQHVQNSVDAGVITSNALLQVRLRKQELASNRLKLENADKILRLLLAQQIGYPDTAIDIFVPDETADISIPSNAADITVHDENMLSSSCLPLPKGRVGEGLSISFPTGAGRQGATLALCAKAVEAQQLQVRLERGKCLPTVAVGVMGYHTNFGGLSDNVRQYVNTTMTNGLGLVTLSVPISAWFGGTHAIRRAKIKLEQAQNDLINVREQLAIDTESKRLNTIEAYEQISIARTSVEESEENLRIHTDQYRVGKTTITDLLDAETLNRKAHDQLSSAIAAYHVSLMRYQMMR